MGPKVKILITRSQNSIPGGGEDKITLHDLLEEAGYRGTFETALVIETEDDYEPFLGLVKVTV